MNIQTLSLVDKIEQTILRILKFDKERKYASSKQEANPCIRWYNLTKKKI